MRFVENRKYRKMAFYIQFFFKSLRTRNGYAGAPFILQTCDILQVVANAEKNACICNFGFLNCLVINCYKDCDKDRMIISYTIKYF